MFEMPELVMLKLLGWLSKMLGMQLKVWIRF